MLKLLPGVIAHILQSCRCIRQYFFSASHLSTLSLWKLYRGYGHQWKNWQIASRARNKVLCKGKDGTSEDTFSQILPLIIHAIINIHFACYKKWLWSAFDICFLQVLLPLLDQYFKNHCLYFLSSSSINLSSSGYASNKEKEMITRFILFYSFNVHTYLELGSVDKMMRHERSLEVSWTCKCSFSHCCLWPSLFNSLFCKLASLVRHRISLFGKANKTWLLFIAWSF